MHDRLNDNRAAAPRIWLNPGAVEVEAALPEPEQQAEVVRQALIHLEQVQQLVCALDEIPGGDRQGLISELAATADSLRQLYFLDAIY